MVTARSAGRAIVEEAIARRSEVIVLGSQSKRRVGDKVFGRTIEYVLEHLPCEAIINVVPRSPAGGGAVGGSGSPAAAVSASPREGASGDGSGAGRGAPAPGAPAGKA